MIYLQSFLCVMVRGTLFAHPRFLFIVVHKLKGELRILGVGARQGEGNGSLELGGWNLNF